MHQVGIRKKNAQRKRLKNFQCLHARLYLTIDYIYTQM